MSHLIKLTKAIQNPFHADEGRIPVYIDPTKIEAMGRKTLCCKREVHNSVPGEREMVPEYEVREASFTEIVLGCGKYLYRVAETPERVLELQGELSKSEEKA